MASQDGLGLNKSERYVNFHMQIPVDSPYLHITFPCFLNKLNAKVLLIQVLILKNNYGNVRYETIMAMLGMKELRQC